MDAHDKGRCAQEPDECESLKSGSELAEGARPERDEGSALTPPTITGPRFHPSFTVRFVLQVSSNLIPRTS